MIRIVENNDWVIFTLLGVGALYLVMLLALQRGGSVREFLSESVSESQNIFVNSLITSVGFCIVLSVLMASYIPILPKWQVELEWNGFGLNKIGFFGLVSGVFLVLKSILSLFFYWSIGQAERFLSLILVGQKFYFLASLVLMGVCIMHYYFPIDRQLAIDGYFLFLGVLFIAKLIFYVFHRERPLPSEWYYKILYICTLQILPLLAVWKLLFL